MSGIIVTTADDVVDANDTVLSLREAITLANENTDADTERRSPFQGRN